jgi:hypothetical protein
MCAGLNGVGDSGTVAFWLLMRPQQLPGTAQPPPVMPFEGTLCRLSVWRVGARSCCCALTAKHATIAACFGP